MKLAVVGSRGWKKDQLIWDYLKRLPEDIEIVSGGASGVDSMAAEFARAQGKQVMVFPADWRNLGKRAGFIRNEAIVNYCDRLVAFWDGQSKGTAHSMRLAQEARKPVKWCSPSGRWTLVVPA